MSGPCNCPTGFRRCAGRCLLLLDQLLTYTDAEAACASLGAHLAVPRSEEENQCVLDMAGTNKVWFGITTVGDSLVASDGLAGPLPAFRTWWGEGEPNNYDGIEDCVNIRIGAWNDCRCSLEEPMPLCQLKNCQRLECP